MKKIITICLLGISTVLYAGDNISCVDMSEDEFSNAVNRFKNSINLSHYKTEDIKKDDREHIGANLQSGIEIKKCIHLQNIKKYGENDDRRYSSLSKLQSFALTSSERTLYRQTIENSRAYFQQHSNASFVGKNNCFYPLLYLTAQNSNNGGVIVYEYRLVDGTVKQYHKRMFSMEVKPMCGDSHAISNYIAYLSVQKGKKFTLVPPTNSIDTINQKVKENINRQNTSISREFRVLDNLKIDAFIKGEKSIRIAKGEIVKYQKHFHKNNVVFLYKNKKYIVSLKTWK